MTEVTPAPAEYKPTVPPIVRTVAFVATVVSGFVAWVGPGLASIWLSAAAADKISDSILIVVGGIAILAGSVGVAYRPTRPDYTVTFNR